MTPNPTLIEFWQGVYIASIARTESPLNPTRAGSDIDRADCATREADLAVAILREKLTTTRD